MSNLHIFLGFMWFHPMKSPMFLGEKSVESHGNRYVSGFSPHGTLPGPTLHRLLHEPRGELRPEQLGGA